MYEAELTQVIFFKSEHEQFRNTKSKSVKIISVRNGMQLLSSFFRQISVLEFFVTFIRIKMLIREQVHFFVAHPSSLIKKMMFVF